MFVRKALFFVIIEKGKNFFALHEGAELMGEAYLCLLQLLKVIKSQLLKVKVNFYCFNLSSML